MIRRSGVNKYHARKVKFAGYTFDSQAEFKYYMQHVHDQDVNCTVHESFEYSPKIIINGYSLAALRYAPDFVFRDNDGNITKVVDVKGNQITSDARIRILEFEKHFKVLVTIARLNRSGFFFEEIYGRKTKNSG